MGFSIILATLILIGRVEHRKLRTTIGLSAIFLAAFFYWISGQFGVAQTAVTLQALSPKDQAFLIAAAAQQKLSENEMKPSNDLTRMFRQALHLDPNQITALGSLAMIAMQNGEYEKASDYWQRILVLIPPNSAEAKKLMSVISKAQLKDSINSNRYLSPNLVISVRLKDGTNSIIPIGSSLYVFARAVGDGKRGPPLAAKKIDAPEFPMNISLSPTDSLTDLKMKVGDLVNISARVSRHGPLGRPGDLQGTIGPIAIDTETKVILVMEKN